ncbi:flavin reductase family protein [Paenibacillus sp. NEAU-GSW1]|uniref:flavin reductase family protein n=1 Tax=Paenibacillus sp. NEAU-GSW1 TaxID=2682486 RepID=UPI0012E2AE08|nr:flavin reductase family protein [Paenibacillus sp. NEAU-GSW1]MUT66528.1 flavin reductase family protein [Paenibacillus sp. NEAU-GSW1]
MVMIDPSAISARDNYKLLIGSIIPRPIAFVTTLSADGVLNAAPFSFFNIVSSNPPMVSVSVQRRDGVRKDTARNAIGNGQFVVHIADESYVEQLNVTAGSFAPTESEVAAAGLTPVASERIAVPGIAEARIRLECELEHALELGGDAAAGGDPACDLLIGRVVYYHIDDALYDEHGHIDPNALQPVSRLAGHDYAKLGELFTLERPL